MFRVSPILLGVFVSSEENWQFPGSREMPSDQIFADVLIHRPQKNMEVGAGGKPRGNELTYSL